MSARFKAGHIKRIKIKNFMTYDEEEMFPQSGLNLIIGLNGSGKSSIMCAICLGLGGKPQYTGRATQLSDFIKHGQHEAVIEIDLFKRPGKIISICRTIKAKASNWTLNNKPSSQNEILSITEKLNIDPSNLCQFLPQEKVVEFSKMDKRQRLENMLKAIGEPHLVELFYNLRELRMKYCEIECRLKQLQTNKDENEKKNERLKPEIDKQNEREKLQVNLETLNKYRKCLDYAITRKLTKEKKVVKDEKEKKKIELAKCLQSLQQRKENIVLECKQKQKHIKHLEKNCCAMLSKIENIVQTLNEICGKIKHDKIEFKNQLEEKENWKTQIEDLSLQIKGLEEIYEKSKSEFSANEEKFQAILQKGVELEAEYSHFCQLAQQTKAQASKFQYDVLRHEKSLSLKQRERGSHLEKLKNINRAAYEGTCWLENNKHRFKSNVFSPVMFQIKVKRDEDRKYVESYVPKRDMFAFICENKDDADLLITILKTQKKLSVNVVMTADQPLTAFQSPDVNNTDRNLGLIMFMRDLFTAPDPVMKYLCSVFKVHRVPVCSTEAELNPMHFLEKFHPTFYTPTQKYFGVRSKYGEKCWSTNITEFYGNDLLASSKTDAEILELEEKIQACKEQAYTYQTQYGNLEAKTSEIEKLFEKNRQEKQALRNQQQEFEQMASRLKQKKALYQAKMSNHVDESILRMNVANTIKKLTADGQKLVREQKTLLSEFLKLKLEQMYSFIQFKCIMKALESVEKEIKNNEDEFKIAKDEYDSASYEYSQTYERAKTLFIDVKEFLVDKTADVLKHLPKSFEEIDKKIMHVNAQLNLNPEVNESVLAEYSKHLQEIKNALSSMKECEEEMQTLKREIDVKKIKWLSPLETHIHNINKKFSQYFKFLKCAGEIDLDTCDNTDDFPNYGLQIKLKYREEEPFTELSQTRHSGGECSVAAIIFILSLQELTQVPFRCIDEINQGMDSVNERKIYQLVSDSASTDNCSQYFLLTPKLLMNLSFPKNVVVHSIYNTYFSDKKMNVRKHIDIASNTMSNFSSRSRLR